MSSLELTDLDVVDENGEPGPSGLGGCDRSDLAILRSDSRKEEGKLDILLRIIEIG